MKKTKAGAKPKQKSGSIAGKDARNQAIEAAKIAAKNNRRKIKVRINLRTEILIFPDQWEEVKKRYGLS